MNLYYFSMIMLPACFHLSSKNRHSYLGLVWTWWNNLPNYCCGHGKKCANSGENLAVFYNLSPHVAACRSNKIVTNRAYNSTLLMLCIYTVMQIDLSKSKASWLSFSQSTVYSAFCEYQHHHDHHCSQYQYQWLHVRWLSPLFNVLCCSNWLYCRVYVSTC